MKHNGIAWVFEKQEPIDESEKSKSIAKVEFHIDFEGRQTLNTGFGGVLHPSSGLPHFNDGTIKATGRGKKKLREKYESGDALTVEMQNIGQKIDVQLVSYDDRWKLYHFRPLSGFYSGEDE